ncbi:hypothetical protein GLAREA_00605 [Glarea lozoyensis ATCC 20868]|uniref:Uncharacterized protein n=1 Tax=Glarea lozoyensis (strain ATCC 20868 / MF5171) TaxID=1116229 RepID=S3CUX4_GLAL2|nr:uncharacterized protein GLAREA_00605 [Glarea lozoyensis ATCC 20868]EPE29445.1 hypothetical protein GLAREA_00605 [Glarea lozoyensis ATCC 20868]
MLQNNRFNTSYSPFSTRDQAHQKLKTPLRSTANQGSPVRLAVSQESTARKPISNTALRPTRTSSLNLFSIISKFEALDAVSLPCQIPALQPAPLQVSHNSVKRRGETGATGHMKKLDTVFSPDNHTPTGRKTRYDTQENTHPEQESESIFNEQETAGTIRKLTPVKSSWRNLSKKNLSSRRSRSSLLGNGRGRSRSSSPTKPRIQPWSGGMNSIESGSQKRGKSIKDMIRFYDGAFSSPRTTRAKPSLISTPTPHTPLSRMCHEEKKALYSSVRRNLGRQEKWHAENISPRTPFTKKANEIPPWRTQETVSRTRPGSQYSTGPKTPPGSLHISPKKNYQGSDSNKKSSPRRSLRASMFNTPDGGAVIDKSLACSPPISSGQGRYTASSKEIGKRLSSTRAKVGNQIEALYRAKSMERQREISHDTHNDHIPTTPTRPQKGKVGKDVMSSPGISQPKWPADVSPSRVLEMKKLFEKQILVEEETMLSSKSPAKPLVDEVSLVESEGTVKPSQRPSPPPPPPLPNFSSRTSGISPKTIRETLRTPPGTVTASTAHIEIPESLVVQPLKTKREEPKGQRLKSRLLGEKIKLFEDIAQRKARLESRRKKRSFSGKNNIPSLHSRKSIFEMATRKTTKSSFKSLSPETIQETVEDVQHDLLNNRRSKRKTQQEKFYNLPQDATSDFSNTSYLTARDDMPILQASTNVSLDMVVKEAQCGLREPKPMRLVEMKRMMLLCREKAGVSSSMPGTRKANVSSAGFGRLEDV